MSDTGDLSNSFEILNPNCFLDDETPSKAVTEEMSDSNAKLVQKATSAKSLPNVLPTAQVAEVNEISSDDNSPKVVKADPLDILANLNATKFQQLVEQLIEMEARVTEIQDLQKNHQQQITTLGKAQLNNLRKIMSEHQIENTNVNAELAKLRDLIDHYQIDNDETMQRIENETGTEKELFVNEFACLKKLMNGIKDDFTKLQELENERKTDKEFVYNEIEHLKKLINENKDEIAQLKEPIKHYQKAEEDTRKIIQQIENEKRTEQEFFVKEIEHLQELISQTNKMVADIQKDRENAFTIISKMAEEKTEANKEIKKRTKDVINKLIDINAIQENKMSTQKNLIKIAETNFFTEIGCFKELMYLKSDDECEKVQRINKDTKNLRKAIEKKRQIIEELEKYKSMQGSTEKNSADNSLSTGNFSTLNSENCCFNFFK